MEIRKAYKFKLKPNTNQKIQFAKFAGCSRFVWNRALALVKHSLERKEGYLNYHDLAEELTIWKQIKETDFLTEVHSQPLQQTLKDLDRACKDAFKKEKAFHSTEQKPRFHCTGRLERFEYEQVSKRDH